MTPNPPSKAMWIAMECSVTVSMGDETRGVLREIRFVTGVSKDTFEAAKPSVDGQHKLLYRRSESTYEARQNEEVVISQSSIDLRVEKGFCVQSVSSSILFAQNLQSCCII